MKTEINIEIPKGMEIDVENSTFTCIKFRPIKRFVDNCMRMISGYYINHDSVICKYSGLNSAANFNLFATEKQAKSALAMARISQIMANDDRFGGVITDEEWNRDSSYKYVIFRKEGRWFTNKTFFNYRFLSFHTKEQLELFIAENMNLIKEYLMID